MTANTDLMTELDAMQREMLLCENQIENAFHILDGRMKAWKAKRHEIIKCEVEKVIKILSERDAVSFTF